MLASQYLRGAGFKEGNYTTYTEARRTAPLKSGSDYVVSIDTGNKITETYAYVGDVDLAIVKLSDASFTFVANLYTSEGIVNNAEASILGKYWAYIRDPLHYIDVYKEGTLIASLPTDDVENDQWYGILVSPSGKYIVGLHRDVSEPATDQRKLVIFEGS